MKLVVGLGNPGRKYKNTPHNAGFEAIDIIAERIGNVVFWDEEKFYAKIGKAKWANEEVLLVKPLTFMNESGVAVSAVMRYKNLLPLDLIVLFDDINLECGRIRIRPRGSSGGHKGLDSVINEIGSSDFPRIRIGIGLQKPVADMVEYVLSPLSGEMKEKMMGGIKKAADAFFMLIEKGIEETMNKFNGPVMDDTGHDVVKS